MTKPAASTIRKLRDWASIRGDRVLVFICEVALHETEPLADDEDIYERFGRKVSTEMVAAALAIRTAADARRECARVISTARSRVNSAARMSPKVRQ